MTRTLPRILASLTAAAALAGAVAAVPAVAHAQEGSRQCQVNFFPQDSAYPPASLLEKQPSGQYNVFQGGGRGVRYTCAGDDVTIESDSAAYYGDLNILYMIGNVRYREPRAELDADQITYYRSDEWVLAQGNVFARMENGSTMQGPSAEYYRAIPAIRPAQRVLATGRPTLTLVPEDSAGAAQEPVTIVADRVTAEGDSLVYAGGQVLITRPDVLASADSAFLDEGREFGRLMRSPRIEGRGERAFTLTGQTIDLFSRDRALERVLSMGEARVVSEDMTVRSDMLDLRLVESELQRAYAWGPSRAFATSPGREIVADSLDVLLPGQRLETVHALGDARIESEPDTTRVLSEVRDWLSGDTVIANFDGTRAPGDTSSQPRIRDLVATGDARSFQQIGPDSGRTECPSIHYVRGRTINVLFDEGRPLSVRVTAPDSGMTAGVYLDATGASERPEGSDAPGRPAQCPAPTRTSPPPVPSGGVRDD